MKRSLLAFSALATCAGFAYGQSAVTLYGTVDLSGRYLKNEGSAKRLSLARDGINFSQLGFRGIEDLGGGLKAGFVLLSSVGADSGDIGAGQSATGSGKFWARRSTVSLFSGAGELRLGRDYTPTFWNNAAFDAFGNVGLGAISNVVQLTTTTFTRADNSIGYLLPPSLGGFYGQAMAAAAEPGQAGQTSNNGRYLGARIGFAAGPYDVALAAGSLHNASPANVANNGNTQGTYNIGAAYDFGLLKLLAYYDLDLIHNLHKREQRYSMSAAIPFGQSEIHVGYDRSRLKSSAGGINDFTNTVWQAKATYLYNLSKRTAVYTTIAQLDNGDRSQNTLASGTSQTAPPLRGGTSKGFELGMRHFF